VQAERREIVFGRTLYWALGFVAVGFVLYWLRDVLTPVFLAFTIAYILDPLVDRLEAWRIPRAGAIAIVFFGFAAIVAAFLFLIIPEVAHDVATVAKELPEHAKRALVKIEPFLTQQGIQVPKTADEWIARLKTQTDSLSPSSLAPVGDALKAVIGGTASALGAVFGALIVPILAVYLLNDFDRMVAGIHDLIPMRWRPTVVSYAKEIDATLSQFMRGQLTVMAILAVLYGGSYWLLGIRLAIPIGIAAGILNFIPYVGSAFALVAGLLMALIGGGGPTQFIGVVIAYAVVQSLEGFVITPRIVGESVGLPEIWVLIALFIAGEVFGFLGVLLAVPAAAVLKIFIAHALAHYRQTGLFLQPAEELVQSALEPASVLEPVAPIETVDEAESRGSLEAIEALRISERPPPSETSRDLAPELPSKGSVGPIETVETALRDAAERAAETDEPKSDR
jgi:predicted PurR-regulated permease PerM